MRGKLTWPSFQAASVGFEPRTSRSRDYALTHSITAAHSGKLTLKITLNNSGPLGSYTGLSYWNGWRHILTSTMYIFKLNREWSDGDGIKPDPILASHRYSIGFDHFTTTAPLKFILAARVALNVPLHIPLSSLGRLWGCLRLRSSWISVSPVASPDQTRLEKGANTAILVLKHHNISAQTPQY